MYLLKALRPDVNDALTGEPMPEEGVKREILLPPDHYAERTGDISITALELEPEVQAAPASLASAEAPQGAAAETPAADARTGRSGKGSSASAT